MAGGGGTFRDTLPPRDRHLVARLESFGDIIFGFAISQLVLHLPSVEHAGNLVDHPIRWIYYFGTFGLLALMWFQYHRIFSLGFAPGRIDLALNFIYLAFVGLVPYAMAANDLVAPDLTGARIGFAAYTACVTMTTSTALALNVRGARRAWAVLDEEGRLLAWRLVLRLAVLAPAFALAVAVDLAGGVVPGSLSLVAMLVALRVVRHQLRVPRPSVLGIGEPGGAGRAGVPPRQPGTGVRGS